MGLLDMLDGFFPDDPRKAAQMQMALGLLAGSPGTRKNFGADLSHAGLLGMNAYGSAQNAQQERQLRQMQLDQMKRAAQEDQDIRSAGNRAFAPAVNQPPDPYEFDQMGPGTPQPQAFTRAAGGGLPQLAQDMLRINPLKGVAFQQSLAKQPLFSHVDPEKFTPESLKAFAQSAATGQADYSLLKPRVKKEFVGPVAVDPYEIQPGAIVDNPQSEVVRDKNGKWVYNTARISPMEQARLAIERSRLGLDQSRLGMERARLAFDTGMGAEKYGFPEPKVPGLPLSGLTPKQKQDAAGNVLQKGAETAQTARMSLPQVEAEANQTIGLVDKMLKHPGMSDVIGMPSLVNPAPGVAAKVGVPIPGTDAADFSTLRNQLVGKQFLQAFETLKGGGQITEVEGKKATDAIARMSTSQSEKAFKEAAEEFKSVIRAGVARARQKAGVPAPDPLGIR